MSIPSLRIIVALDEEGGFAKDGKIPWNFSEDFDHFKKTTAGHHCIMGRRTAEDILGRRRDGEKLRKMYDEGDGHLVQDFELLPGRTSIVLSRNLDFFIPGAEVVPDLRSALEKVNGPQKQTFILGGEKLFTQALPQVSGITVTLVPGIWGCDRHFLLKYLMENFKLVDGKTLDNSSLRVVEYSRVRTRR